MTLEGVPSSRRWARSTSKEDTELAQIPQGCSFPPLREARLDNGGYRRVEQLRSTNLARKGMVVVTINYRLALLGLRGAPPINWLGQQPRAIQP